MTVPYIPGASPNDYQPFTDAQIAQYQRDNPFYANYTPVRTASNSVVFVDPNRTDLIEKYRTGELTGNGVEAVPAGAALKIPPTYTPPPTSIFTPTTPAPQPPPPPAPAPTPPPVFVPPTPLQPSFNPSSTATVKPIDLAAAIQLSSRTIDREYVKGTMKTIPVQEFEVRNVTTNVNVTVGFRSIAGVIFTPNKFTLPAAQVQKVVASFDLAEIDKYPEGVNTVTAVLDLNSDTVLLQPTPPSVSAPPITPTPIVPETPVLPQPPAPQPPPPTVTPQPPSPQLNVWNEERFEGSPNSTPEATIFSRAPFLRRVVPEINYVSRSDFPPPVTVRWTMRYQWQGGTLQFETFTDDGMRIRINGREVWNRWVDQPPSTYQFAVDYPQGVLDIVVEYYNDRSVGVAKVNFGANIFNNGVVAPPSNTVPDDILPPPPPPPLRPWVSGINSAGYTEGGLYYGTPPAGWLQDPYGGCWYPPNDPFVLSGWGRNVPVQTTPTTTTTPTLPPPPPPTQTLPPWVDGTNGQLNFGTPPVGWVNDPFGGAWYPPNDPYVLNNFNRPVSTPTPPPPFVPPAPLPPPPAPPAPSDFVWVDGTGQGGLNFGQPPAGWVRDPFGGAWYPGNDPYVLSGFGGRVETTSSEIFGGGPGGPPDTDINIF